MKRSTISRISALISACMVISSLASCAKNNVATNESATTELHTITESETSKNIESSTIDDSSIYTESSTKNEETTAEETTEAPGSSAVSDSSTEEVSSTEEGSSTESNTTTEEETDSITNEVIELSNDIKNGVNVYYSSSSQSAVSIENKLMNMEYRTDSKRGSMLVSHLSTKQGNTYIRDTMDIVLRMKDGNVYYASSSADSATLNIYRMGFYFYEARLEGQSFTEGITAERELAIPLDSYTDTNGIKRPELKDGVLSYRCGNIDPYIVYGGLNYNAADYDYIEITLRTGNDCRAEIWMIAGGETTFNEDQRYGFDVYGGNEFITYYLPVSEKINGYRGTVQGIRFDINAAAGESVEISSIRAIKADFGGAPASMTMQRSFITYSTKLHHLVQICTEEKITDLQSIDMITDIDANTVASFVLKDKNGLKYDTLEGVDWDSCEYVGFDIKDAGIFGYILPCDGNNGTLRITLDNGIYTVTQSCPIDSLSPSALGTANANDFYMGQRIYTDENHTFDEFIKEAECERHPLTAKNITVDEEYDEAKFIGYDSLYGHYRFSVAGTGFNQAYYVNPNKQFRVNFTVSGDEYDRIMYFMVRCSKNGNLECSVLLGDGDLLLPVPMEVCKNFGTDGENTIYNLDDIDYSESYFPMIVHSGEKKTYTVVNLYQNWGIFPLKQISSIQFHLPYYHLSTGVTETNCIVPITDASGPALPDHRAMSAPLWPTQPQHTSGGGHSFIRYINDRGQAIYSTFLGATIDSYGPTYADIEMKYATWDNKIEATYIHTEMPQTDENRAFYEMSYVFKEDIAFSDFAHEFSFYNCTDNDETGLYQRLGYLDRENVSRVTDAMHAGESADYVLGDNCPYFTLFDMAGYAPDSPTGYGYVNISFLIYDYKVVVNGEEIKTNFIITNKDDLVYLSLDLDEVTFKAGDTISINAIIMPWGSQESDYSGDEPDANVRRVRENTLLDPVVITPSSNCQVMESKFTPKIRTTNGYSAEFSISGGENNVAVRVYGFDKLTAPTIKVFENGRWVSYKTSSASNKDDYGYGYMYDGYMVHYDSDGTYSYSFVIDMTGNETKQFRIDAYEDFKKWPKVEYERNEGVVSDGDPINVYVDANELNVLSAELVGMVSSYSVQSDGEFDYIRYYASDAAGEAYIFAYDASHSAYASLESTGQYMVLKYRLPKDPPAMLLNIQYWASTVSEKPQGTDKSEIYGLAHDGTWQVVVVDLSALIPDFFTAENGSYKAKFLRLDFFNQGSLPNEMYIDIAYIGLCDSLEEICKLNLDMEKLTLIEAMNNKQIIDPSKYPNEPSDPDTSETESEITPPDVTEPSVPPVTVETPLNVYIAPEKIKIEGDKAVPFFSSVTLAEDGDYVRFYGNSAMTESILTIFSSSDEAYSSIESTGQYAIIKYRLPKEPATTLNNIQYWSSTLTDVPQGKDKFEYSALVHDGEWHVLIIDLSATHPDYCIADGNGVYNLKFFRLDVFNSPTNVSNDMYMDIAYFGFCDDLSKAYEFNSDMDVVSLIDSRQGEKFIDPKTGEQITQ